VTALSINTRIATGGAVVITVRGDLEYNNAGRIHDAVRQAVDRYRPPDIVLDLGLVTFMATEATGHLAAANTTARASGTRLIVRDPSPAVRRLLALHAVQVPAPALGTRTRDDPPLC
jgi:anti-anti-sigma factor